MKHLIELLLAVLLGALLGGVLQLGFWAQAEAPLIHSALWNFSSSSYDVKNHSAQELATTQKILVDVKHLVGSTDCSLNGCPGLGELKPTPGLLPQVTTLVRKAQPAMDNLASASAHLDQAIQHTDGAIQSLNALLASGTATMAEVQSSLKRVNDLIVALQGQVSDPSIKLALDNLAASGKAMAEGMQQLAAASTDVRQIADKARETYLKPVNLWWGLVKELLPLAGSAAQVVK